MILFPNRNPLFKTAFYSENYAHDVYVGFDVDKIIDCGFIVYQCLHTRMLVACGSIPFAACAVETITFDANGNTVALDLNEQAHESKVYKENVIIPAPPIPRCPVILHHAVKR